MHECSLYGPLQSFPICVDKIHVYGVVVAGVVVAEVVVVGIDVVGIVVVGVVVVGHRCGRTSMWWGSLW